MHYFQSAKLLQFYVVYSPESIQNSRVSVGRYDQKVEVKFIMENCHHVER